MPTDRETAEQLVAIGLITGSGEVPTEILIQRYLKELRKPTQAQTYAALSMVIILEGHITGRREQHERALLDARAEERVKVGEAWLDTERGANLGGWRVCHGRDVLDACAEEYRRVKGEDTNG